MACHEEGKRKIRITFGRMPTGMPTFGDELGRVINCSLTVPEFEITWATMLDDYKLKDNKHLKNMFDQREEWVPAYFRGIFFAEMTTTQRSESMNALFKMWVTTHTSIYKFVCKIDNIIENIWQREGDEDMRTMNEEPALWSKFTLEFHARQVYTRKVFSVFKELLKDRCLGTPIEKEQGTQYEVRIDYNPCYKKWKLVSYLVNVDKNAELFSCNCKGFDFEGLLCPHALKVMWIHGIQQLPSHYILKRWCKNANADVKRPINERSRDVGNSTALQMFKAKTIKSQFSHLIDLASKDMHSFNMADAKLRDLVEHLKALQIDEVPGNEVVMDVNVGDGVQGITNIAAASEVVVTPRADTPTHGTRRWGCIFCIHPTARQPTSQAEKEQNGCQLQSSVTGYLTTQLLYIS
ncbi:Protein FAR1-RELATED SEQUENCE 5 [Rhynchospora pubera]|uniref:Protein FAR1-RELATED SEQUENCE n=1 Tax=Rhynchospora pubera TaxID=906938 RepID=A0AAV8FPL4_9POAL|nr:Protein FAR1-RELATED SEQUENCE 5 [Rhynchospora pubera]